MRLSGGMGSPVSSFAKTSVAARVAWIREASFWRIGQERRVLRDQGDRVT
jgi:hypothetical protein